MKLIAVPKRLLMPHRNLKTDMLKHLLPAQLRLLLLPLTLIWELMYTLLIVFVVEILVDVVAFFCDFGFV